MSTDRELTGTATIGSHPARSAPAVAPHGPPRSTGCGAEITADTPLPLKNFLGGGAYTLMGLLEAIDFRPYEVTIRSPAGVVSGTFVVAAICNGRQAGGGEPLAPAALIDEILHRREDGSFVVHRRLPWVEIDAADPVPVNLDGEPVRAERLRFRCHPGSLALVVPPGCPCLGAARCERLAENTTHAQFASVGRGGFVACDPPESSRSHASPSPQS